MAFTHTLTSSINNGAGSVSRSVSFTGDARDSRVIAVPTPSTDLLVNIAIDVDQIKSLYIVADQNLTLETNNSAAPDNTIALKANKPFIYWTTSYYYVSVLTVDVTKIYVTNASGTAATLYIELLQDSTP